MAITGETGRSLTFSRKVIAPAAMAIVVAEATWVSLLVVAIANAALGGRVSVSFLALALPAVVAVTLGAQRTRRAKTWPRRAALLAPAMLVGAILTAGVIGELSRSGSFLRVAVEPWTASGHDMGISAAAAWAVAVLAWGRGVWLGVAPPSFRQTAWSAGLGGVVLFGIVIGRAEGNHTPFSAATGATAWLLLVWFAFAATALTLVRKRDLEQEVLRRSQSQPDTVWMTVIGGPLVSVALVALVIAVAFGPAASIIGHGVALVAGAIGWLISTIAHAISTVVHPAHGHRTVGKSGAHVHHKATSVTHPHHAPGKTRQKTLDRKVGHNSTTPWLAVAAAVPATFLLLGVCYLFTLGRPRRARRPRLTDVAEDEERDTVFTWRHLANQLKGALRALRELLRRRQRRLRRAPAPSDTTHPTVPSEDPTGGNTVRHAYRRMLITARASGSPRTPAETTHELQGRLSDGPAASAAKALAGLTVLYDAERYGEVETDEPARTHAVDQADAVSSALREQEQTVAPRRSPSGVRRARGRR
jgi:Domain of unknown function (DUF4129)